MKLNDLQEMSLTEAIKIMEMVEMKVHSDNAGTVCAVEVKYVPKKEEEVKSEPKWNPYQ